MIKVQLIEDRVVKVATNFRYEKLRDEITKEINSYPIIADSTYKVKSKEEKELLKRMKTTSNKKFTRVFNSFYKLKNK